MTCPCSATGDQNCCVDYGETFAVLPFVPPTKHTDAPVWPRPSVLKGEDEATGAAGAEATQFRSATVKTRNNNSRSSLSGRPHNSGSFAILAAIRRASSCVRLAFWVMTWFNFLPIRAPFFFETEAAGLMCVRHSWPQSFRWCVPRLKWLWQRGDIHCDAQCLFACELSYRRLPTRPILKMDVREWPACFVMHNKTG